jgi:hypothetical protein
MSDSNGINMTHLQVVRVDSLDGDTHFILIESTPPEKREKREDYDEAEVKRASKVEAAKPLILARAD